MDYTINNLSNKFDIKRLGSLMKALEKISDNNHDNYEKSFISDDDDAIFRYIEGLRTRLNNFVQKVANEFMYNYDHKLYLNKDAVSMRGEDGSDDYNVNRKSDSSAIEQGASNYIIWFSTNALDERGLLLASTINKDVSLNSLRNIINSLKNEDMNKLELIVAGLLASLMLSQKDNDLKAVCNVKFIPFALTIFTKSNMKDENLLAIRDNLNFLLNKYSVTFASTTREATKIAYRKALLIYVAYTIQKQRCS
jgi:hypothetical protein